MHSTTEFAMTVLSKCVHFACASLQATGRLGFRGFLVASHGKRRPRVPEPSVTRKQMVRMNMSITLAPLIASQGKHSICSFFAPEHTKKII